MIIDIGGGTADIAVIALDGTVVSESVKVAGDDFDEAILRYMRKKHLTFGISVFSPEEVIELNRRHGGQSPMAPGPLGTVPRDPGARCP